MVLLRLLRHPYIVKYKDFWQEELHVFIVMEYCQGKEPPRAASHSHSLLALLALTLSA
jgi:serine/threonine protein kinase